MKRINWTHVFTLLTVLAICLLAVLSGRDLELGPDGLRLHSPQSLTAPATPAPGE